MWWKKEHKCYRGAEVSDCCNSRVEEAVARRTNNIILIISIALLVMALTIKTVSEKEFVAQVSFASTITSIILSVIAIWMSITGERSTNEIKTKVSDSVEKLVESANETKSIATNLKDSISEQTYDLIKEQMEMVAHEMREMKTSFSEMSGAFTNGNNLKAKNEVPALLVFKNIVEGISGEKQRDSLIYTVLKIFEAKECDKKEKLADIVKKIDLPEGDKNIIWGIVVALDHNGFFSKEGIYQEVQTYIEKRTS